MSKQFAVIPLNFDVLTFSDKSLEKYRGNINMVSTERLEFNNDFFISETLNKLQTYLRDRDSYFIVPIGENDFLIMLKENTKRFIDLLDCEFSITRRD